MIKIYFAPIGRNPPYLICTSCEKLAQFQSTFFMPDRLQSFHVITVPPLIIPPEAARLRRPPGSNFITDKPGPRSALI